MAAPDRPALDPAPLGLLAGQRAIITGGAHGIGRAAAIRFAAEGARVAVLDIDGEAAQATADEVGGIAVTVDMRDLSATSAAVDEATAALGGLTAVFANAGIGESIPIHRMTDEDYRRLVDANLGGTFATIRAAIPH